MTLVVGTAGHIDHGKTTLLRALTGIDADRLPEERRRGMTIDVGYAHLTLDDGSVIDFVDVPGHDRLVGNMLVGAGEIDAALLVVAADDGPRAQTLEHLALLDALGVASGIAVVTKIDAVPPDRVDAVMELVRALLAGTVLAGARILAASGVSGAGIDEVRAALGALPADVDAPPRPPTLPIDRVFSVKGRGSVVTGTLRGGPLTARTALRLLPGGREVRIREIQVRGERVDGVDDGGRTALNLGGVETGELHRGMTLTADPTVVATDRVLAAFGRPISDRARGRVHAATSAADATIGRSGRDAITLDDGRQAGIVRLDQPIPMRAGDRFLVRRGTTFPPVGGVVLDPQPPRGIARRRQTAERVSALAAGSPGARRDLHGIDGGELAPDVATIAEAAAVHAVGDSAPLAATRTAVARALRRQVTVGAEVAATTAALVLDRAVEAGRLVRDGDTLRRPGVMAPAADPTLTAAMDRLEATLAVAAPPPLGEAATGAGCPPAGIRALERAGRIVVLETDIAYASSTYREVIGTALAMASTAPLTPAAFRDATGTSRKYVMAILEDLDRRAILRRTPDGHVPGPKAPAASAR
jgi:selenocysteine-specific elongation factor